MTYRDPYIRGHRLRLLCDGHTLTYNDTLRILSGGELLAVVEVDEARDLHVIADGLVITIPWPAPADAPRVTVREVVTVGERTTKKRRDA